jgi:gallate dioxygenase
MIRRRDWSGLVQHGAIFFGLEKLAAVLGLPNAVVYAGMRGESLDAFQASRNAPGALYSVGSSLKSDEPST